jgi:curved DNA-binding protein CbpA
MLRNLSPSLITNSYHILAATFRISRLAHAIVTAGSTVKARHLATESSTSHLLYIPHAFSLTKAANLILAHDQQRFFSPITKESTAATPSHKNPLKAVLVPVCGVNAHIHSVSYQGQIGRNRTVTDTHTDSEGRTSTTTRIVTDWYSTNGVMSEHRYTQNESGMSIYFGEKFNDKTIEQAVEGHAVQAHLKPFHVDAINRDIHIDPWKKVDAFGMTEAAKRINHYEISRAKRHIRDNNWWVDDVLIDHISIRYKHLPDGRNNFYLQGMMLPIYALEYPSCPTRILPAITDSNRIKVVGAEPLSDLKIASATAIATTIISFLFPQVAIPTRVLAIVASTIASGAWAHFGLSIQHAFEENRINNKKAENAKFSRTYIDDARLNATSRDEPSAQATLERPHQPLNVDAEFYEVLGLNPDKEITDKMIKDAFTSKIKLAHSDKCGGDDANTIKIVNARNEFNKALQRKRDLSQLGKRHFSIYSKPVSDFKQQQIQELLREPPQSSPNPNASYLIKLVLDEKQYDKALSLIKKGQLHVDAHDPDENTLLTEAVKRKDVAGVKFALETAKCSADLSCDCPLHNTAMHYWAAGAGSNSSNEQAAERQIFNLLIQHKARINLINSAGQTPLDMAKNEDTRKILISHGAVRHSTQHGIAGLIIRSKGSLFGYRPDQRTRVIKEKIENTLNLASSPKNISDRK